MVATTGRGAQPAIIYVLAPPSRYSYSPERLRLVLTLLTIITLPIVIGSSVLIYYYLRYSVMVERRLQGEHWMAPSRLYARPLVLRPGLHISVAGLVKTLNGLKYEQKTDTPAGQGEFMVDSGSVVLVPRTGDEPIAVVFDKNGVKEMRGLRTKRLHPSHTLEPELITYLFEERDKRRLVRYEELPDVLIKAVLAIEDRRFFSHPGLDPFRILAAAIRNIKAESYIQGGSTITQQLVKNFFLTPERTFRRKVQEALLAFVLERRAQKKDILELYLNEVYLGQVGSFAIHGVGEAARMYFHKDVGNLTLVESAMLAGMIASPNPYNPYRHPDRATERRNQVLRAMADAEYIPPATAEAAMAQPLKTQTPSIDTTEAPYFVDLVRDQLAARYDARDLKTQNLAIYTSLDFSLQGLAQSVLCSGLERVEKMIRRKSKQGPLQGALIALDPQTGAIVALVGGRSYGTTQYNRVIQARRQPGSTFKPFVYLAAFEATFNDPSLPPITPATVVDDAPSVFIFGNKDYTPENYEGRYMGYVTLRKALALSLNNATVKVAEMVGYEKVADLWSKSLAIGENIKPYPAVALGAFEATPLEMATAYNVLANLGLKVEPTTVMKVTDEKGAVVEQHYPKPPRVVHAESAFLVTNMMRSVITSGTAYEARKLGFPPGFEAAGKTGTTNDMKDAWFGGFTADLLCIVWVGYDDNTPINLSGARAALPIWVDFMKGALAGMQPRPLPVPSTNIVSVEIDAQTGLRAGPYCPKVVAESFVAGTEPIEVCQWHNPYSHPSEEEPLPEPPRL